MGEFSNSKDISINDCLRFTDPNLSSINYSYQQKTAEAPQTSIFRSLADNKENSRDFSNMCNTKGVENSYTFESNQSMEMCSSAAVQVTSPFCVENNNANNGPKLNNTGKFAFSHAGKSINSIEFNEDRITQLDSISVDAKEAIKKLQHIISDISQLTTSRWEALHQKFVTTCSNLDSDEIISIMMGDDESQKYIAQRMREILNEDWAAERETTIHQLTKQIGMLEMKHSLFLTQVQTNMANSADKNRMNVLNDILQSKETEIRELKLQSERKDKELAMLKKHCSQRNKTREDSSGQGEYSKFDY